MTFSSWSEHLAAGGALTDRTYSEIVWLGAGWTAPTRANANRTTGLPNSYDRSLYWDVRSSVFQALGEDKRSCLNAIPK
jgi:hypothetical protein